MSTSPRAVPTGAQPLAGIRVLAIEQYGAGPYATLVLADLGADVIKIEPPGRGDVGRAVPPFSDGDDSLFFQSLNRGKRSLALDLKRPEGRALFERLVGASDVVFANARGRTPASLQITYADLQAHNPAIVCAFLTGFGRSGPRSEEPAYDYIVQALSGMAALGGEPDGPPARAGVSVVDFAAGLAAAVAILAGVHRARATGEGGDLDTSLFATALNLTNYVASWVLTRGYVPERMPHGGHPSLVPSQMFATADGWLMVMCQTDAFYRSLVHRLGLDELAADARFSTMASRFEHRTPLLARLEATFRTRSTAAWLALLEGHVPVAPVNDLATALGDPQVAANDLIVGYDHPSFGPVRQVAGPVRPSARPAAPSPAPALGADTRSVLTDLLDLDESTYRALLASGVVA